jgi:hypothetical protein
MLHSPAWRAGLSLLASTLAACTSVPPAPLPQDHPASIEAPAAPPEQEPSALASYRDFGATPAIPPRADEPAMDQSAHPHHHEGAQPAEDDAEDGHANHQ